MWFALCTAIAVGGELTLADALQEAIEHNLESRQARTRLDRSAWAVTSAAGSFYDPTLGLSVGVDASSAVTNDALAGVERLETSGSRWDASLTQNVPTGARVTASWSEGIRDSNSQAVTTTRSVDDTARLAVSQPLLDGGGPTAALAGLRGAKLSLNEERLAWRASVEQLALDVSAAYWRLVSAHEAHRLAGRSREIAEQSLSDARERYDQGFAGSGDVLQVERALGVARQSEVVAAAEVEAAEEALKRRLGIDLARSDPLVPVDLPLVPEQVLSADQVMSSARAYNAEWLQRQVSAERALLDFKRARNGALPDLSVDGAVGLSGLAQRAPGARRSTINGDNTNWRLGASLSVPLAVREPRAALAMARLDRDRAELALAAAEQDLLLRVQDAVRGAQRDRSRLELAGETLRVAQLALDADQEMLREGRGSARDVVVSLEALDQAQVDRLSAEIDLQASLLELQRVAGTLLANLGLDPDP